MALRHSPKVTGDETWKFFAPPADRDNLSVGEFFIVFLSVMWISRGFYCPHMMTSHQNLITGGRY